MTYVDFPINSHLDRLAHDKVRDNPSLFSDTWMSGLGAIFGWAGVCLNNAAYRKPVYTGKFNFL